ncbi:hypothetical protein AVEN_6686-1 [Araneus ventricosus]|uniref:Uncharacterized protein n=1 Tax=Araneus ventricosus TaxID=182803 RepID=A0A4Y2IM28_ARAVE|nr:hypothetical protein AVEN_6686-1 [Araneus ventricosus]
MRQIWPKVLICSLPKQIAGIWFQKPISVSTMIFLRDNTQCRLMVRPRLRSQRFQARTPNPLKIRRVWSLLHVNSYVGEKRLLIWCGILERGTSSGVLVAL